MSVISDILSLIKHFTERKRDKENITPLFTKERNLFSGNNYILVFKNKGAVATIHSMEFTKKNSVRFDNLHFFQENSYNTNDIISALGKDDSFFEFDIIFSDKKSNKYKQRVSGTKDNYTIEKPIEFNV